LKSFSKDAVFPRFYYLGFPRRPSSPAVLDAPSRNHAAADRLARWSKLRETPSPIRPLLGKQTPFDFMISKLNRSSRVRLMKLKREMIALVWIALAIILGSVAAANAKTASADTPHVASPADPLNVLGNAACIKCHASEHAVWAATPHSRTFDELHRRPEASAIAKKLGVASVKHGERCVGCHYTQKPVNDGSTGDLQTYVSAPSSGGNLEFEAIAGISCESCHGAARGWLETHHNYGGENITRQTESPEHRADRIARSVALGMRNPHNVYLVAQSCYRCHTTGDEELVNVGGHPAGSLDFEIVSWSQGTIHHNFVKSDGKQNQASSANRLRFLFVAGVIADTESSLRAVSTATVKADYALTVAKRAARAGARLKSVAGKVNDPRLNEAVAIFDSVKIKLNNATQLEEAANSLAKIGIEFANAETAPNEQELRESLKSLDKFIPARKNWK
jgi:hypothetical protein